MSLAERQFSTRPAAFPTAAASVRIFFIRSSGLNSLPFTMPMAANCPASSRIVGVGRLVLDVGVDHLEERVVAWRDRIERLAARLHELGLGNRRVGFEPDLAFERRRDARADASRRVGIDLHVLLDVLDGRLRIVVYKERARCIEDPVRLRPRDVKAALGKRAVIARRHEQVSCRLRRDRGRGTRCR